MALWSRAEQLVAFWLYSTERFGRLHKTNPLVVEIAERIGRTPDAVAMKACNFASLDPVFVQSGRAGLSGASNADRALWAEFEAAPDQIAAEAAAQWEALEAQAGRKLEPRESSARPPEGPTETIREVPVRRVQRFFRSALLASYEGRCAVTGLALPELLVASHIKPWAEGERYRADPRNGILLNALLDRAFDRHLISFDDDLKLVCSRRLQEADDGTQLILDYRGAPLRLPERFTPDRDLLADHRRRLAA